MQCFSVFIDANWWLVNPHLQYRMQWSKGMLSKTALESTDSCPSFVSSQEGNRTYILPVSQETRDPSPWKAVAFEGVYRKCWPFLHKCEVKKKKKKYCKPIQEQLKRTKKKSFPLSDYVIWNPFPHYIPNHVYFCLNDSSFPTFQTSMTIK